jgi:hypothetical protein
MWQQSANMAVIGRQTADDESRRLRQVIDLQSVFGCRWAGTFLDTCRGMESDKTRLMRHLGIAVALKLVVITALWFAFVQDARVVVGAEQAAAHFGTSTPPPSGAPR